MTAEYLIVQYVADLFRQESRNIGVIVRMGAERGSRFSPSRGPIYAQWVQYWERMLPEDHGWEEILKNSTANYRVIRGGEIDGVSSLAAAMEYLFAMLVL